MTPRSLHDLYVHQLKDLYSAEEQLIDALPTMAEKARHPELKRAFEAHLEETRGHRERLEQVFRNLDEDPSGVTCKAMKGLISEAKEFIGQVENMLSEDAPDAVIDAGLIADAQRVEHYEIAGYGTVSHYAEMLGRQDDARILQGILDNEKSTDEKLNRIAKETINPEAAAL
jgi:ferritin-like metal-binding protein YciE